MATTQKLVNNVLTGLRQFGLLIDSSTTTITDDYLLMILQFVNEAKEEIEEAGWSWHALRKTVTLTLVAAQAEYDLLSASEADVDTNDRTRLLYENVSQFGSSEGFYSSMSSIPMVFDVTDSGEYRLKERTQEQMERLHFTDNDERANPSSFSFYTDGDSIKMKMWPTPTAVRTIKLRLYIPQATLASTAIDTTTLLIPNRPVWTLALFKANQERGDELGRDNSSSQRAALDAHGAATGREMTPADQTVFLER